jgi:two-component system sensor histidine kinase KdpD
MRFSTLQRAGDRRRSKRAVLRSPLAGYLTAVAGVAAVSILIDLIVGRIHVASIPMLYLLMVLATAVRFGSGPAVLASVLAFLAYNWFFIEPTASFTAANPEDWLALLVFLATAIATGQLAAAQRRRADEARRREKEALELYELGRVLVSGIDLEDQLKPFLAQIKADFGLSGAAVILKDGDGRPLRRVGDFEPAGFERSGADTWLFSHGKAREADRSVGRWVKVRHLRPKGGGDRFLIQVPVRAGEHDVGILQLESDRSRRHLTPEDERFLAAAANQIGQAMERDRLDRQARLAEVLRRTDELKTALLNSVSHDLRTPLALIKASGESLLRREVGWDEETRDEFAGTIVREADRLNRLVGNLLDMSRIEAGALKPNLELYPLADLINDLLDRLTEVTAEHPVSVVIPDDLPPVPLDYLQIEQVLTNLIENAVKYSPPRTPILISAEQQDDAVAVTVADRGPGIPAAALPQIFDRFFRVEDRPGGPVRGTGLGLAVVKGLVEAHGGTVGAESAAGKGTEITFRLPLAAAKAALVGRE